MRLARTLLFLLALGLAGMARAAPTTGNIVRVGLALGSDAPRTVVVSGQGRFEDSRAAGSFDGQVHIRASGGELVLNGSPRQTAGSTHSTGSGQASLTTSVGRWVELRPTGEDPWLEAAGTAYRGRLRVELQPDGRLKITNIVDLEDYLRGVIAREMFADAEAFKAQAVVSRTLALYVRDVEKRHKGEGFDLCTTGHCQFYGGVDAETALSDEAVFLTFGEALTAHGAPILAAYHANAGGRTEVVDDVWPGSLSANFTYLAAVPSPFDNAADKLPGYQWCYRWRRELDLGEIADRLAARGQSVGRVRDLIAKKHTRSGRIRELEVVGAKSRAKVVGTAAVREVLGAPSSLLQLHESGGRFVAEGYGYGDGIGLSQHGALGMAWAGYRYDQILGHYYQGVQLTQDCGRGASRPLHCPPLDGKRKLAERRP